jgi:hypothetical protein
MSTIIRHQQRSRPTSQPDARHGHEDDGSEPERSRVHKGYKAAMMKMMEGTPMLKFTGDADIYFHEPDARTISVRSTSPRWSSPMARTPRAKKMA